MGQGFDAFVGARSIAVVGASERNIIARIAIDNLRGLGFPGRVFGIHPRGDPVDGMETFPSHQDAGDPADLAVLAVGAPRLEAALRAAAEAGVRSVVVPGAGSNEGGPAVWPGLSKAIEETGVRALGPNCMGFASFHRRVVPYVGSVDPDLQAGGVGLVSQSGSVLEMYTAMPWRIGFSHVISVGNELGVDMTGALEFLVADEDTHAIGLFIEGVRRPEEFRATLRRAAEADKPVVMVKVGVSELARAGAASHTGALAGDARVFAAVPVTPERSWYGTSRRCWPRWSSSASGWSVRPTGWSTSATRAGKRTCSPTSRPGREWSCRRSEIERWLH